MDHGLCIIADQDEVIRMGLALAPYDVYSEVTIIWLRKNNGVYRPNTLRALYTKL
jgi:hypothetical protein